MVKQLKGLAVHEVSGVDAAANRRRFLLSKSATTKGAAAMSAVVKSTEIFAVIKGLLGLAGAPAPAAPEVGPDGLDGICCKLSDAIDGVLDAEGDVAKSAALAGLLAEFSAAVASPEMAAALAVEKAEGAGSTALADVTKKLEALFKGKGGFPFKPDEDEKTPKKAPKKKTADGEEDDEMAQKNEGVAKSADVIALEKRLADQDDELKKAKDEIAKEREIRLDGEFLAKAKDIGPVPGSTFEQTAALLKATAGNAPLAKQTEATLRAAAKVAKESDLLKEVGKGGSGAISGDAGRVFLAKAKEHATTHKVGLTEAMGAVAKADPQAYADYVNESRKSR